MMGLLDRIRRWLGPVRLRRDWRRYRPMPVLVSADTPPPGVGVRGDESPARIAAAAIRVDGETWTLPAPARHCHLVHAWCTAHWVDGRASHIGDHEQGFVTEAGLFVGRVAAGTIALDAGQIDELAHPPNLYSEDLW